MTHSLSEGSCQENGSLLFFFEAGRGENALFRESKKKKSFPQIKGVKKKKTKKGGIGSTHCENKNNPQKNDNVTLATY